ncbi:acetyltransferase [Sorangium cellulosum]|uniref:Acetyltransferase n=1 Tax=Sorangium cellulosum TaxID=56 RepID=A0A2L0EPN9_SORCE|nr:GNAT family N-acetyltransferase [Sorangium cellulosum]AUX41232.1 acetyltransferase [Sorangium cellulosum]
MSEPITRAVIRRAQPADAATIARVEVDSWRAAYLGLVPAAVLNALSAPAREASWRRILSHAAATGTRAFLLCTGGAAIGFASAGPTRDEDDDPGDVGELYTLYLLPVAWGRGLGAALLDTAQADLARRRHRTMTIWVLEGNTRARRFYELSGFARDGARRAAPVGPGSLPEIRYRRAL